MGRSQSSTSVAVFHTLSLISNSLKVSFSVRYLYICAAGMEIMGCLVCVGVTQENLTFALTFEPQETDISYLANIIKL